MKRCNLILFLIFSILAHSQNHVFEFVIAPGISPDQLRSAQKVISQLILQDMNGDDILSLVDAHSLQRTFTIHFDPKINGRKPAMRRQLIGRLHPEIRQLKGIFSRLQSQIPTEPINLLRYLRNIQPQEHPRHKYHVIWIGSPIIRNQDSPFNDFSNGYANDAALKSSESVWSTLDMTGRLKNVHLSVVYSASLEEFTKIEGYKDQHRQKIERLYALFLQLSSGHLVNFGSSVDILSTLKTAKFTSVSAALDTTATEPITYEFQADSISNGAILGTPKIWKSAVRPPTPLDIDDPKTDTKGQLMIGLRFQSNENPKVDLDLHTQLAGDREISFRSMGSEASKYGGQLIKDFSSSAPLESFGHEAVLYTSPDSNMRDLRLMVNHFGGLTESPIKAEIRILHNGIVYKKEFEMHSKKGDRGTSDRSTSPNWKIIDVREILGAPSSLSLQAAPGSISEEPFSPTPDSQLPLSIPEANPNIFTPASPHSGVDFLTVPKAPSDILILVDLSGSMHSGVGNTFLGRVKSFFAGKSRYDVAINGIKNFLEANPDQNCGIGTYSTDNCSDEVQIFSANQSSFEDLVRKLEAKRGQREQLKTSLLNAPRYFGHSTRPKRLYIIGDADDACRFAGQSLCDVVEELHTKHQIEVTFYSFALADHNLTLHPCLKAISSAIY